MSNARDSPVVQAAVKLKHKTYGLIETLANVQAAGFGASRPVKFVAAAITHQGEMSNEFLNLVTKAVGRYRNSLRLHPDIDGNTAAKAASIYIGVLLRVRCVRKWLEALGGSCLQLLV